MMFDPATDVVTRYKSSFKHRFAKHGVHNKIIDILLQNHSSSILDVGCARGYLGEELLKKNNTAQLCGIEYDASAAEIAKKFYSQIWIGKVEDVIDRIPPKQFDAIVCADVLEHTPRPDVVLMMLRKVIKDDGILVTSIPNIVYAPVRVKVLFGKFDYEEAGHLDKTHLRFFTIDTAIKMVEESGFSTIKVIRTGLGSLVPVFPTWLSTHALIIAGTRKNTDLKHVLGTG